MHSTGSIDRLLGLSNPGSSGDLAASLDNRPNISTTAPAAVGDRWKANWDGRGDADGSPRSRLTQLERPVQFAWERDGWGEEGARCGGACAVKEEGDERQVVPLLCGRWSCPVCGRLRYKWFVRNVKQAVEDHKLRYFWTLTIAHGENTPAESWELISAAWNRFRTAIARRHGPFTFVWVVEPQRSGHAHLHVLTARYLEHKEVSELWASATGGSFVVWVQRVKSDTVAVYLAKYVSKLSGQILSVPGMGELVSRHRYGKSRDIAFSPFRARVGGWEYMRQAFVPYLRWAERSGRLVERSDKWVPSFRVRLSPDGGWPWLVDPDEEVVLLEGQLAGDALREMVGREREREGGPT